jgi:hypothetical protein
LSCEIVLGKCSTFAEPVLQSLPVQPWQSLDDRAVIRVTIFAIAGYS